MTFFGLLQVLTNVKKSVMESSYNNSWRLESNEDGGEEICNLDLISHHDGPLGCWVLKMH